MGMGKMDAKARRGASILVLALVAATAWTSAAIAGTPRALYGSSAEGQIFVINLATGRGTLVGTVPPLNGPPGLPGATEIECDPNSPPSATVCYFQYPDGAFTIQSFTLPMFNSVGGQVGDGASFTGLEFVGTTLYGTAIIGPRGPSTLRTLNPTTGASVVIGLTGVGPISGLAFDATTSTMYGIGGGPGPAALYTLNLTTGVATVVGSTGIRAGSLEFGPDGLLYAGGTGDTDGGNLFRIDPATAQATLVGATGFDSVTGLTVAPAPPASAPAASASGMTVIAAGLILVAYRSLRRRAG